MNRGKRGRPFAYADGLIETIGTFRLIIDTPYRQCEGAAVNMLGRENTPHFTTLCRRLNRMAIVPGKDPATASVVDGSREIRLAIDGSGLIPSTRGEWIRHVWKVKRGFIRLSILVDVDTKMVLAFAITDESVGESPRLPTLLDEALEKLGMPGRVGTSQVVVTLMGDKAYDSRENFSHCRKRGVAAGIPVKVNANCRADGVDRARTEAVLDQLGGGGGRNPQQGRRPPGGGAACQPKGLEEAHQPGRQMGRRGRVLIVQENPGRGRPGRKVALYHPGGGQQDQRIQLDAANLRGGGPGGVAGQTNPRDGACRFAPRGSPPSCPAAAILRVTPPARSFGMPRQGDTTARAAPTEGRHMRNGGIVQQSSSRIVFISKF